MTLNCTFLSWEAYSPSLAEDSDLVCQPGAKWMDVNETLKEKGITNSFLPSSFLPNRRLQEYRYFFP